MIEVYYGSFRHWEHPFIDYKEGLKKLFDQVHKIKTISNWFVKALANDLAKKVLGSEFKKQRKWFVDPDKLELTAGPLALWYSLLGTGGMNFPFCPASRSPMPWIPLNS